MQHANVPRHNTDRIRPPCTTTQQGTDLTVAKSPDNAAHCLSVRKTSNQGLHAFPVRALSLLPVKPPPSICHALIRTMLAILNAINIVIGTIMRTSGGIEQIKNPDRQMSRVARKAMSARPACSMNKYVLYRTNNRINQQKPVAWPITL